MIYLVMGGVIYEGHWIVSAFKSKDRAEDYASFLEQDEVDSEIYYYVKEVSYNQDD